MGTQVRILELAEQLIRLSGLVPYHDVQIVFTGLRPGEKLEEELIAANETLAQTSIEKIRVVTGNGAGGTLLARQLRTLIAVTGEGDEHAMMRALSTIVTEYQPERLELVGAGTQRRSNGNGNGYACRHANGNGATRRRVSRRPPAVTDQEAPVVASGNGGLPVLPDPLLSPDATTLPPPGGAVAGGGNAS